MKEIQLTQGKVALVDDVDYEWLNQWKWSFNGRYAIRWTVSVHNMFMHREILSVPQGMDTDHRDGNGLNNQRNNIRICTTMENLWNCKKPITNSSGYKGVWWDKRANKWRASICVNYIPIHLGMFSDLMMAAFAYDEAAVKFHGEFARLNFPKQTTSGIVPANSADPG